MTRKRIWLVGALALTVGAAGIASLRGPAPDASAERGVAAPLPVDLHTVVHASGYTVLEQFAGRVVAKRSSELGFERSGTLLRVFFDEGDRVEAGEVLAELDVRTLQAQRAESDAQAAEIRAQLDLAKLTSERRRKLHASEHLSSQRLDEAVYAERGLVAKLAAVHSARRRIDVALELSRIVAPYGGSVDGRYTDEGTVVSPGQPILRLIEDRALEARIGVPPATATALEIGSGHPIEVDGRPLEGVLHAVLESVSPDTRTVTAIFLLPGETPGVRSGALARVALPREVESPGFWLPLTALAEGRRGLWSAYVVEPDAEGRGIVERRQLEVLHAESDRAFVRGTVHDGETVVATGLHRLVPGLEVSPASHTAAR